MPADEPLPPLRDDLALLTDAVRAAAELALGLFGSGVDVWSKAGGSPVSAADIAVDKLLAERLRSARPHYGWLSEESEDEGTRLTARRTFIADPIDGTRDFISGGPHWTIPVAIIEAGRPVAAVLAAPKHGELFAAAFGMGATKNGATIAVSDRRSLEGARLAISKRLLRGGGEVPAVRAGVAFLASLAYRLARVADGRLDGAAVKPDAQDWDLAAADLILHEAGGELADLEGRAPRYDRAGTGHSALVAAPPALAGELRRLLGAALAGMDAIATAGD